jgi:hypothetical protein
MSYTTFKHHGQKQWNNWTYGLKHAAENRTKGYGTDRRKGRRIVRELKKASTRAERLISKRELRNAIEEFEGGV